MNACPLETSVPDWVSERPETRAVFQWLRIDDACGATTLGFAYREQQGLQEQNMLSKLHDVIDGGILKLSPSSPSSPQKRQLWRFPTHCPAT